MTTITRVSYQKRTLKNHKESLKIWGKLKVCSATISTFLVILVALAGVFYLAQINHLMIKGYEMKELDREIKEVSDQGERLEYETLQAGSLAAVQGRVERLGLASAEKVDYLSAGAPAVAVRD